MKNTQEETLGNNIPSKHIKRILIPLFTQENPLAVPGLKYFFPENPHIDRAKVVGMEAHLQFSNALALGDIRDSLNNISTQSFARQIYLVLYNENNEEIFYNFPLRSLFTFMPLGSIPTGTISKRIKPITCKLKTRSCYAYIPANGQAQTINKIYISLSIYYN
jgi:hypothetical protein